MKRKILLTVIATTMIFGSAITANAAQEDVFDAEYYAETYPDVVAVFGNDENVLLQHYLNYGITEGRSASAYYNALVYKTANADLAAAFGDDWDAYADHFINYGADEGRYAGGTRAITDEEKAEALAKMAGDVADTTASSTSTTDLSQVETKSGRHIGDYNGEGIPDMTAELGVVGAKDENGNYIIPEGIDPNKLKHWDLQY